MDSNSVLTSAEIVSARREKIIATIQSSADKNVSETRVDWILKAMEEHEDWCKDHPGDTLWGGNGGTEETTIDLLVQKTQGATDKQLEEIPPYFGFWAEIDFQKSKIIASDAIVLCLNEKGVACVLVGQRLHPAKNEDGTPHAFPHLYCLPGGMLNYKEDPLMAALRELEEETGLILRTARPGSPEYSDLSRLRLLGRLQALDVRDKKGRIVTEVSYALIPPDQSLPYVEARDDLLPDSAQWMPIAELFQHALDGKTWAGNASSVGVVVQAVQRKLAHIDQNQPENKYQPYIAALAETKLQELLKQLPDNKIGTTRSTPDNSTLVS